MPRNWPKMTIFLKTRFFWCNIIFFLSTWNNFFVQYQLVFVDISLLFVQRQTFCFDTKLFFVQHQIFILDMFKVLCHGNIFSLSHSNDVSFSCEAKTLISFFEHHKFLIFNFYIPHFFVIVLETKKLLIHLLLTCLIYRSSYQGLLWKKGLIVI